jgi:GntR family transcriptional regulator, galactonate operon transcriptional repressor
MLRNTPNPGFKPKALAPDKSRRTRTAPAPSARLLKSAHVVDVLGFRIVSGALAPGALLPTEAELSTQLGISRPSLREGLRALAQKGLVEGRTRRGTTVNDRRQWNVLDADVLRWLSVAPPDPAFFMDLLDVRLIVEPNAARLAAARASPEQVVAIEAAYRGMERSTPYDMEACCEYDLALHELIITATGNAMLIRFAAAIRTALLACVRIASVGRERSHEHSLGEHRAVVAAIRRRDPEEAERAMRNLLAGTISDLAPAYDKYPHGFPPPPVAKVAGKAAQRT